jgi:hypothetical protein
MRNYEMDKYKTIKHVNGGIISFILFYIVRSLFSHFIIFKNFNKIQQLIM